MNAIPARFARNDPRTRALSARFIKLVAQGERLARSCARARGSRRADLEWRLNVVEAELGLARLRLSELVQTTAVRESNRPARAAHGLSSFTGRSRGFLPGSGPDSNELADERAETERT